MTTNFNRRIIGYLNNRVTRGTSPQISSFIVHVYLLLAAFELYMFDMANLKECVRDYDDSISKETQCKDKGFQNYLQLLSP